MEDMNNRVFGLDVLRFVAIFMVLIGHSLLFVPQDYKPYFYKFLLDGVAIFFVLSGYLIGGILIRQLEREKPTFKGLLHFWKRRWMRTLPAYLVVLIILLVYTSLVLPHNIPGNWYRFLFFTQNLFAERPPFFAEAWSLSIEEWFYLTVPFILFSLLYLLKTPVKWTILFVSLTIIGCISYYRYHLYHVYGFNGNLSEVEAFKDYIQLNIEYAVVPRLDTIMFGLIGAFLAHYYPKIWSSNLKYILCLTGMLIAYYTKFNMGKSYAEYNAVWLSGIRSLCFFFMLPLFANMKKGLGKWTSWVTFFSLISYSMYLVNLNIVSNMLIKNIINGHYKGKLPPPDHWYVNYILFWVFTVSISFISYKLIEVPFMKLRDRKKAHTA